MLKQMTLYEGAIVERLQMASIDFVSNDVRQQVGESASLWRVPETKPCYGEQFQSNWQVSWLPPGFLYVGNRITAQGEHVLMFADGIVSFSVFVLNHRQSDLPTTARHGATTVVIAPMKIATENSVAVVGELPVTTVQRIAKSVTIRQ